MKPVCHGKAFQNTRGCFTKVADKVVGADVFCNLSAEYELLYPDFMLWSKNKNPLHAQKRGGLKSGLNSTLA